MNLDKKIQESVDKMFISEGPLDSLKAAISKGAESNIGAWLKKVAVNTRDLTLDKLGSSAAAGRLDAQAVSIQLQSEFKRYMNQTNRDYTYNNIFFWLSRKFGRELSNAIRIELLPRFMGIDDTISTPNTSGSPSTEETTSGPVFSIEKVLNPKILRTLEEKKVEGPILRTFEQIFAYFDSVKRNLESKEEVIDKILIEIRKLLGFSERNEGNSVAKEYMIKVLSSLRKIPEFKSYIPEKYNVSESFIEYYNQYLSEMRPLGRRIEPTFGGTSSGSRTSGSGGTSGTSDSGGASGASITGDEKLSYAQMNRFFLALARIMFDLGLADVERDTKGSRKSQNSKTQPADGENPISDNPNALARKQVKNIIKIHDPDKMREALTECRMSEKYFASVYSTASEMRDWNEFVTVFDTIEEKKSLYASIYVTARSALQGDIYFEWTNALTYMREAKISEKQMKEAIENAKKAKSIFEFLSAMQDSVTRHNAEASFYVLAKIARI